MSTARQRDAIRAAHTSLADSRVAVKQYPLVDADWMSADGYVTEYYSDGAWHYALAYMTRRYSMAFAQHMEYVQGIPCRVRVIAGYFDQDQP
jgi:hypothetical protein